MTYRVRAEVESRRQIRPFARTFWDRTPPTRLLILSAGRSSSTMHRDGDIKKQTGLPKIIDNYLQLILTAYQSASFSVVAAATVAERCRRACIACNPVPPDAVRPLDQPADLAPSGSAARPPFFGESLCLRLRRRHVGLMLIQTSPAFSQPRRRTLGRPRCFVSSPRAFGTYIWHAHMPRALPSNRGQQEMNLNKFGWDVPSMLGQAVALHLIFTLGSCIEVVYLLPQSDTHVDEDDFLHCGGSYQLRYGLPNEARANNAHLPLRRVC